MESCSSSLMATDNGINRKRHVSLDKEDADKGSKRVCVEPFRGPMGLASSSDYDNSWKAEPSYTHPDFQSIETALELINSFKAQSPTRFTAQQSVHDSADLISNHDQVFGASHSTTRCTLPSIASLPFMFLTTGLSTHTLGPRPSSPTVMSMSQHKDNGYLSFHPDTHQIEQINNLEFGWGTDLSGSCKNPWANPAASPSHQPNSGPQERLQYFTSVQSQSPDTTCFPANVENSAAKTGMQTGVSTEWLCMENKAHLVESELITNADMKSRNHSPASGKSGEPLKLHGVSSSYTNLLTELNAWDEVSDSEFMIEFPPVPQHDACFGVVGHRRCKQAG